MTFVDFVRGLLSEVPRKNSWQIAEYLGYDSPGPLEWLLNGAVWEADDLGTWSAATWSNTSGPPGRS